MSVKFSSLIRDGLILCGTLALTVAISAPPSLAQVDSFEAGKRAFQKKDFAHAKVYFDKAAVDMPWDSNVLYYQALTCQYCRDFTTAKKLYQKIAEQFPGTDAEKNARAALRGLDPGWESRKQAAAITATATAAAAAQGATPGSNLPAVEVQAPAVTRVPLIRQGDKVYMSLHVNGRGTKLEYAGSETCININDAITMGLVDRNKPPAAGSKMPVELRLGDIVEKNFPLAIGSAADRSKIGDDVFKAFNTSLEPTALVANFRNARKAAGGYQVPFRQSGKDIMIDVTINGRRVSMVYDDQASECVVPASQARNYGLEVQETSSYNIGQQGGPVRGEAGYGELKKTDFADARIQLGPVNSNGVRIKVDENCKQARIGPSALGGWKADIDKSANVIHFSR